MKQLLATIFLFYLCSCDDRWSAGGGGISAHIDVRTFDESLVLKELEKWMTDHGYERRSDQWSVFTGDGQVTNNDGERVYPVTYVKQLSEGRGHFAWGIAAATENHHYVTVFQDAEFQAAGKEALDELEKEFDLENLEFRKFIDEGLEFSPRNEIPENAEKSVDPNA